MKVNKKEISIDTSSVLDDRNMFESKQQIAVEKYGEVYSDEVFFALELTLNSELDNELNNEYNRRKRWKLS